MIRIINFRRLLCCVLACLLLCGTVMRPVAAEATVAGATAGLAYVTVEAAIPWILSVLSVGYLASYGSELFYSVKEAICKWAVSSSLGQALKAYSYGSDYCLDSDVVDAAAGAVNTFLAGDFTSICQKGLQFSSAYIISYKTAAGETNKCYYWGNAKPTTNQNSSGLSLVMIKPGIFFFGQTDDYTDYSSANPGNFSFTFYDSTLLGVEAVSPSSLVKSDVTDVADQLARTGIWVVDTTGGDNDNGKKHYYPVIPTKEISSADVETTDVTADVESSSNPNDVSFEGFKDFLNDFWTGFKTKMLEIPDILREIGEFVKNIPDILQEIKEFIKNLPETLVQGFKAVQTGLNKLVDFFTGTMYVPSPLEAIAFDGLFDLFPFNIPYGIYEAVTFWEAGESPPVITIPLPTYSGGSVDIYEFQIDFSEIPGMDTLVAIIRGGELILFAVGLLMITRKVTKW